ncbi:hypothetical protein Bca4012_075361 [Brassica carinata]|uniref:Uncharacterized protein n=1 Tax=Brassica carinata TaxID=52824 RepID=A0A8X7U5P0_BRACI|nr:hypothetical protein Bca52824_074229 [Brassica carinata]
MCADMLLFNAKAVGVGNPKDFKTTNNFVSRHEGESKTRGMNRKSRGNGGEARVNVKLEKLQLQRSKL